MNNKKVTSDFLNHQWKPAPMFYGFKPNVRPYVLPHNRGKLPMPKSGHIYFNEVAALDKAKFNPLPNKPELQLPGKIFYTEPIPQQKFLNAATVKLINSGKVKAVFKSVQKLNPLSMPLVSQMADTNLKAISLEMIKNAVIGLKYDPTLGTEQEQLRARSCYDNLIVSYTALVDKKQDNPENVKKIIAQYEKEMIAIYGPGIKKPVKEDILRDIVFNIQRATSTLVELYEMIDSKKIGLPQVEQKEAEGGAEEGEGGGGEGGAKEEVKVKEEPDEEEIRKAAREKEEDEVRAKAKAEGVQSEYDVMDDIENTFLNDQSRRYFVGDYLANDPQLLDKLLIRIADKWTDFNNISSNTLINIAYEMIRKYNKEVKDPLEAEIAIPSPEELNNDDVKYAFIQELSNIFKLLVEEKGVSVAPTVGAPTVSAEGISQKWYAAHSGTSFKEQGIFNNLYKDFGDQPMTEQQIKDIIVECVNKLTAKERKNIYFETMDDKEKYNLATNVGKDKFEKVFTTYIIEPAIEANAIAHRQELAKAQPQAGPGRKRKSRKRPSKKSVKKMSAKVNKEIFRLLKS
jgi:hypothetical protein